MHAIEASMIAGQGIVGRTFVSRLHHGVRKTENPATPASDRPNLKLDESLSGEQEIIFTERLEIAGVLGAGLQADHLVQCAP